MVEGINRKAEKQKTKLIIEDSINTFRNSQPGAKDFTGRGLTLHRNREGHKRNNFYRISNLSRTESVEVIAKDREGLSQIDFSEEMLAKLAQYLREECEREGKFDCFSFVHHMHGIPYEHGRFDAGKWNTSELSNQIKVGDVVFLSKVKGSLAGEDVAHCAIFLGKEGGNFFISKYGQTGSLIVSSLVDMKDLYEANYFYKGTPKV